MSMMSKLKTAFAGAAKEIGEPTSLKIGGAVVVFDVVLALALGTAVLPEVLVGVVVYESLVASTGAYKALKKNCHGCNF